MGEPKGLLAFAGESWLEKQLIQFATYGSRAVVVLGYDADQYFQALPFLKRAEEMSLNWNGMQLSAVINIKPQFGPFSSIKAGLSKLREKSGAFVLPVDVPAPEPDVWTRLQREGETRHLDACVPEFKQQHGHPVWLSHEFLIALRKVPSESSQARLDYQIHALAPSKKAYLQVLDPRVAMNMNTAEDFDRLKKLEGYL